MMDAFLYTLLLQWKMDMRSKTLLVTCYLVPLLFFLFMGGIFTSVMPKMKDTLIPSMIIMGVSMGSFIGLPPTLIETYSSDIKKVYQANGIPFYVGVLTMVISAFIHLMILCILIIVLAPLLFKATFLFHIPTFILSLIIYLITSLSIGSVLGLLVQSQSQLTMVAQLIFLPSIMLSGIMFPLELLPKPFQVFGKLFPASMGFQLMKENQILFNNLWYLLLLLVIAIFICNFLLKKHKRN